MPNVLNKQHNNFSALIKRHGDHYQWSNVTSCIHNVLGGQRWVDQYGEMVITNQGKCSCKLNFIKVRILEKKDNLES